MADLLFAMAAQHIANGTMAPHTLARKAIEIVSSCAPDMSELIANLALTRKSLAERLVTVWLRDQDNILEFHRTTRLEYSEAVETYQRASSLRPRRQGSASADIPIVISDITADSPVIDAEIRLILAVLGDALPQLLEPTGPKCPATAIDQTPAA